MDALKEMYAEVEKLDKKLKSPMARFSFAELAES